MNLIVLDTNVIVSALWNRNGNPAIILKMFFENEIVLFYDEEIFNEYNRVLTRSKFKFLEPEINDLLHFIETNGIPVSNTEKSLEFMIDESDRKFYDVAKKCKAFLVTGNKKHFPNESFILSPTDFLNLYHKQATLFQKFKQFIKAILIG